MKYLNRSFTMATNESNMSKLEYDLRVGNITQEQYDQQAQPKPTPAGEIDNLVEA